MRIEFDYGESGGYSHGPQTWPWWRLFSWGTCKINQGYWAGSIYPGRRLWIYTKNTARYFDVSLIKEPNIKRPPDNILSTHKHYCKECSWPVVVCLVNDDFGAFVQSQKTGVWDYWAYCSNKGCSNHNGEGFYQQDPPWALEIQADTKEKPQ